MTTHHDPRNCDCAAHRSHSFLALADMQLRAEKAEQKRDERDAAAHAWKEHSREMFRQRQDARTELARFQRLAGGWVTEAQAEATEAVTRAETAELRAEKAEREASDHRANARGWMKTSEEWQATAEEWETRALRAESENPRPLTADDITAEESKDVARAFLARVRRDARQEGAQAQADTYGGQIDAGPNPYRETGDSDDHR